MADIAFWLFGAFSIAAASLLWRRKRQFDRTNEFGIQRHGSFGQKLRADSMDTILLLIGYGGLLVAVVIMAAVFDELLGLLILALILFAWFRSSNRTKI